MEPFGQSLKKERERRKMTLEEISASTKIAVKLLAALEEERFNELPGGVFNRGFVRSYARALSMDEQKTVSRYLQASGEPTQDKPLDLEAIANAKQARASQKGRRSSRPRNNNPWNNVAAVALVLFLFFLATWALRPNGLWTAEQRLFHTSSHGEPPATAGGPASAAVSPYPQHVIADPQPQQSTSTPEAASVEAGNAAPQDHSAETASAAPAAEATPTLVSAPESALRSGITDSASAIQLRVKADAECWVTVVADGATIMEGPLNPNSRRTFRGQHDVSLKAGSIGALRISFNGRWLPSQGDLGEVKILHFDPRGLLSSDVP